MPTTLPIGTSASLNGLAVSPSVGATKGRRQRNSKDPPSPPKDVTITEPKLTKPSASIVEPKPAKSSAEPKPKPTPSVPAADPLLAKQGTSCAAWADLWIGWRKGQCHAYEDRFVAQSSLGAS